MGNGKEMRGSGKRNCELTLQKGPGQGSVTRVIPLVFAVKPVEKKQQNTHQTNLIQFQFVMPVITKDFFMFTTSNDQ